MDNKSFDINWNEPFDFDSLIDFPPREELQSATPKNDRPTLSAWPTDHYSRLEQAEPWKVSGPAITEPFLGFRNDSNTPLEAIPATQEPDQSPSDGKGCSCIVCLRLGSVGSDSLGKFTCRVPRCS